MHYFCLSLLWPLYQDLVDILPVNVTYLLSTYKHDGSYVRILLFTPRSNASRMCTSMGGDGIARILIRH